MKPELWAISSKQIYAGNGGPSFAGTVIIEKDRIKEVIYSPADKEVKKNINKIINIPGEAILAPGFIDTHGHSENYLLADGRAVSKVSQGITTEIACNCGFSPAPLSPINKPAREESLKNINITPDWNDLAGYRQTVEKKGININLVLLVGQGTIRSSVMGWEDRPPTKDELNKMCVLVQQSMEQGARGISTGLTYPPGCFTETEEIIKLAKVASKFDGVYTTHIRNEGEDLIPSIQEALSIAESAEIPINISHLKTSGRANWGQMERVLNIIDAAEKQGLAIQFDRYPYLASATSLDIFLPNWVHRGGKENMLLILGDKQKQSEIIQHLNKRIPRHCGWEGILISQFRGPDAETIQGKTISQISESRGLAPAYTIIQLLLEANGDVDMCSFSMNQEETDMVFRHPLCVIGSDSSIRALDGILAQDSPHPRCFGSFPAFWKRYVKELKIISTEIAINKMVAKTADFFHLSRRGRIQKDYYADLVVFYPEHFIDCATYQTPHKLSQGVEMTIVNGEIVFNKEQVLTTKAGRIL